MQLSLSSETHRAHEQGKTLPELRLSGLAVQAHRHIGNVDLKVRNELEILP